MLGNTKQKSPHSKWTREEYLVTSLAHYEWLAQEAAAKQSWVAAVRAKDSARIVRAELDQLRETESRQDPPPCPEEHQAEILHEVRRMRIGAQAAGSWVAAARLLEQEQQVLAAVEAERREREAEILAASDPDEVVNELVAVIGQLPPTLLELVQGALERRLAPATEGGGA